MNTSENAQDQKVDQFDIENKKVDLEVDQGKREDNEEKETLTCEICYDTIEVSKGAQAEDDQNIFKLAACSHTFCRECFQETYHSLILEQNRHDDLQCPQHGCDSVPTLEEIEKVVSAEAFKKYKQFQDNQRVAKDKQNLMFCIAPNCDQIIDLREAPKEKVQAGASSLFTGKQVSRLLVCQKCENRMCRLCRQPYHGESGKCQDVNKLEAWSKEKTGIEVGTCPSCTALVEKNGGCPHMTCYVCKHDWCWTCGLSKRHFFHRMQILTGETGVLCEFVNTVAHRYGNRNEMLIKSMAVRYFLIFILCLIAPPLLLCGGIVAGACSYPFLPIWFMCSEGRRICRCAEKVRGCHTFLSILLMLLLYVPLALVGAVAVVAASLALALFYIVGIILILRMVFVQCCRSKQTDEKQRDKIEMMVEQRRQENERRRKVEEEYEKQRRERVRMLREQRIAAAQLRQPINPSELGPHSLQFLGGPNSPFVGGLQMADDDEILQRVLEQSLKEHQEAQAKKEADEKQLAELLGVQDDLEEHKIIEEIINGNPNAVRMEGPIIKKSVATVRIPRQPSDDDDVLDPEEKLSDEEPDNKGIGDQSLSIIKREDSLNANDNDIQEVASKAPENESKQEEKPKQGDPQIEKQEESKSPDNAHDPFELKEIVIKVD